MSLHKEITISMPPFYSEAELKNTIDGIVKSNDFYHRIKRKSLDARKKSRIHWEMALEISDKPFEHKSSLTIPHIKTNKRVVVVGSGPAGFFAAYILQCAGFKTVIIEKGKPVNKRDIDIDALENRGKFDKNSNYAFGEGGAGTFSDGKLTSRSKHINCERDFICETYIKAGAPEEILWLSKPHVGSDNLKKVIPTLRKMYEAEGGKFIFSSKVTNIKKNGEKVLSVVTDQGDIEGDSFIFAIGHSSFDSYRMLIKNGVPFKGKIFALGSRVEHLQKDINISQWGKDSVKGLKAAEYKLAFKGDNHSFPVYSFCMCPGGRVVPSSGSLNTSVVNGMSNYLRNSKYANSAIVTAFSIESLLRKEMSPLQILDWLETLEESFFNLKNNYSVPAINIKDFIEGKTSGKRLTSSYKQGVFSYPLFNLFPKEVSTSIRKGFEFFSKRIKCFPEGTMLGLESKTSSPIQVIRDKDLSVSSFDNLYVAGEGSGWSGGIISSGADGIRVAKSILNSEI